MGTTDIVIVTNYINDAITEFARRKQYESIHVRIFMLSKSVDLPTDLEIYDISDLAAAQELPKAEKSA